MVTNDNIHGSIINITGNIIKKIFKSHPESSEYNIYIQNFRSNNIIDDNQHRCGNDNVDGDNINPNTGDDGKDVEDTNGDDGENNGNDNITLDNRQNQTIPDNRDKY